MRRANGRNARPRQGWLWNGAVIVAVTLLTRGATVLGQDTRTRFSMDPLPAVAASPGARGADLALFSVDVVQVAGQTSAAVWRVKNLGDLPTAGGARLRLECQVVGERGALPANPETDRALCVPFRAVLAIPQAAAGQIVDATPQTRFTPPHALCRDLANPTVRQGFRARITATIEPGPATKERPGGESNNVRIVEPCLQ